MWGRGCSTWMCKCSLGCTGERLKGEPLFSIADPSGLISSFNVCVNNNLAFIGKFQFKWNIQFAVISCHTLFIFKYYFIIIMFIHFHHNCCTHYCYHHICFWWSNTIKFSIFHLTWEKDIGDYQSKRNISEMSHFIWKYFFYIGTSIFSYFEFAVFSR